MPDWDLPMFIKVPLYALLFCLGLGLLIGAYVLLGNTVEHYFGPDAAAFSVLGALLFPVVCLLVWMVLDS